MKRKQFLTLSASSAGAVLLAQCGTRQTEKRLALAQKTFPQVYNSTGGLLAVDLETCYRQVRSNSIEDWELANVDPDKMDHPFHLHGNSFQVISRDTQAEPYIAWKDTVLLRGGETVRIRIPFSSFPGKTVYHCHVLDHEDSGMMGIIADGATSAP